ncbi:MAG TPA: LysM peptidoglycan-binding domain-containing protein [Actinomycetota bacterium]
MDRTRVRTGHRPAPRRPAGLHRGPSRGLRLVRTAGLALGLALAVAAVRPALSGAGQGPSTPVRMQAYVVRPGDTVWSIAERASGPGADPRPLVDELISVNHLNGGEVQPGERLLVPLAA